MYRRVESKIEGERVGKLGADDEVEVSTEPSLLPAKLEAEAEDSGIGQRRRRLEEAQKRRREHSGRRRRVHHDGECHVAHADA